MEEYSLAVTCATFADSSARSHTAYVSRLADGVKVFGTHNSTGGLFYDLVECVMGYFGVTTPPVRMLQMQWYKLLLAKGGTVLHICHSQGAIHTRNALMTFPGNLRERIMVVAIVLEMEVLPMI